MRRRLFLESIAAPAFALVGCNKPTDPKPEPNPAGLILIKNTFQFTNDAENNIIHVKMKVQNVGDLVAKDCYGMFSLYNETVDGTYNRIISYEIFPTYPLNIRPNEEGILETNDNIRGGIRYLLGKHKLGVLFVELYPDPEKSNYKYNYKDGSLITINY